MPTYVFYNEETDEEFEKFMGMSEREEYLKENPHIKQRPTAIKLAHGIIRAKPDDAFRDKLKEIDKTAGRHSKVNVI